MSIDPLKTFQQNIGIQKQLGHQWGYRLDNNTYMQMRAVRLKKHGLRINQSITPLQTKQKAQWQNKRLAELTDQIEQMQIKKKMQTQRYEQGKQLNISQLMNQRIREYNYLIDHKQFNRTAPKFTQTKSFNTEQQNDAKQLRQILEKLRKKQQQMSMPGNLLGKFNNNKQINRMYRQFAQSMNIHNKKSNKIPQFRNTNKKSHSVTQMKTTATNKIKDRQRMGSLDLFKIQEVVNIQYPYVNQNFIRKSQQINEEIKRNKYIGELMREKIHKIQSTFSTPHKKLNESMQDIRQAQTERNTELKDKLKILTDHRRRSNPKKIKTNQPTLQQKKQCLASAMKKISPQYIKAEGGKFIKKFDCTKIAKQMIDGQQQQQQKQVKVNQFNLKSISKTTKNVNMNSISTDNNIENFDQTNAMLLTFIREAVDDDYYQTTCRNQKMNLLMKSKKNHF